MKWANKINKLDKLRKYELEKRKIQKKNLGAEEYERKIKELCERLGL